ncbi:MAG: formylmethanofuran dehydrogenase subunit E family protein [Cyclobacteriaceae bacterium]|nr:formylmethanofuran dehydrogenase subunit E family protein [Cyclobacteriaceae bacterium]
MEQARKVYYKYLSDNWVLPENRWVLSERTNVVLRDFPVSPCEFSTDLAPFVTEIIEKHGLEEWKAAVLTNEMHRHLGIYSLIGVKMGILAREILQAGLDEMVVESFTGFIPPVSCMADGLQVSTGASLGRGTIFIKDVKQGEPVAVFIKSGQQIKLMLKREYREHVDELIHSLSRNSPSDTEGYFDKIRNISVKYWLELDRNDIFDIY